MWADTLETLERLHLLRLLFWAAASMLAGTALLAWLRAGGRHSPLLRHFAIQSAAWGVVDAVIAGIALRGIAPRDIASATRLDRMLWLNIGLDIGYVLVGVTLAATCWRLGPRPAGIGAGVGIMLQGLALFLLDLRLILLIGPLQ